MPWVKITRVKNIRKRGVLKSYYPGDSIEVGKQTALQWILDGSAEDPYAQIGPPVIKGQRSKRFGMRIRAKEGSAALSNLGNLANSLMVSYGLPAIPYTHTCIWRPDRIISPNLINYGFYRILVEDDSVVGWEMAAGIVSLDLLAKDYGSSEEQEKTKRIVGDLRLPVYDPRVVWVRKCKGAEKMITSWALELKSGADEYHAFLRALYTSRVMLCTLPEDWARR